MKLSTKGRYAMVALVDIALQPAGRVVTLGDISRRQDISLPYLEQLFVKLRRAGLVESVRGPGGGYRLARPASDPRGRGALSAVDETVDALHKGAGASGGASGSRAQSLSQPALGGAERACLRVPAPGAAERCGGQRARARARRCRTCFGGGRRAPCAARVAP